MRDKFWRWGNVWLWIIFLFIVLVAVNWISFLGYQKSAPGDTFLVQFWNYFGTDAFQALTISLILPILLLLLERIFNVRGAIEERIRSAQEKRTEQRWECIERTSKMWNEMYSLASEVRYFQESQDDELRIIDILRKLKNYASPAEDIVNMWHFRFPILSEEVTGLFLKCINVVFLSAFSVARYILKEGKAIPELQDSLGVIQVGIKRMAHHSIISILKYSMDLMQGRLSKDDIRSVISWLSEHGKLSEEVRKTFPSLEAGITKWDDLLAEEKIAIAYISYYLKDMKDCMGEIEKLQKEFDVFFPDIEGTEVEIFRKEVKGIAEKISEWQQKNPEVDIEKCEEYEKLRTLYENIGHEKIVNSVETAYSKRYIKKLASHLGLKFTYEAAKEF